MTAEPCLPEGIKKSPRPVFRIHHLCRKHWNGSVQGPSHPLLACPWKAKITTTISPSSTESLSILSQRLEADNKLHRFLSFSDGLLLLKITTVSCWRSNWRNIHWLEDAALPFQIMTDHRNIEYLLSAKRLNPRQARWALFFDHLDFSLFYQPWLKNGKADFRWLQFIHLHEMQPHTPVQLGGHYHSVCCHFWEWCKHAHSFYFRKFRVF